MKEFSSGPITLDLQKQAAGRIWITSHSGLLAQGVMNIKNMATQK